jgi:hypothetical protein
MESRFLRFVAASAVFMSVLLLIDHDGLPQQLALGCVTVLFLGYFARSSEVRLRQIVCCIAVATIGEIVLSMGWGMRRGRDDLRASHRPASGRMSLFRRCREL